jgi:hypothetical protein
VKRAGHSPRWAAEPEKIIITTIIITIIITIITIIMWVHYTLQSHVQCNSVLTLSKNENVIINPTEAFYATFAIFQSRNIIAIKGYLVLSRHQNIVRFT